MSGYNAHEHTTWGTDVGLVEKLSVMWLSGMTPTEAAWAASATYNAHLSPFAVSCMFLKWDMEAPDQQLPRFRYIGAQK